MSKSEIKWEVRSINSCKKIEVFNTDLSYDEAQFEVAQLNTEQTESIEGITYYAIQMEQAK